MQNILIVALVMLAGGYTLFNTLMGMNQTDHMEKAWIHLPSPSGPHPVGTVTYHWVDKERFEPITPEPFDLHQVIVQFWYPAQRAGDVRAPYVANLEQMRAALRVDGREIPLYLAEHYGRYARVRTKSYQGTPLSHKLSQFPIVIFSPGGNMSRHFHTALMQELASHGYLAIALSHAHSGWDVFPYGGFLKSDPHWQGEEGDSVETQRMLDDELTNYLAADAIFVLNQLTDLNQDPASVFHGRLDLNRVAIAGHSRGGKTVSRACSTDQRFDACLIFDNVGPAAERESGLRQPLMSVRTDASRWSEARIEALHGYLEKTGSEAVEIVVQTADHFSFSDLTLVDPQDYPANLDPLTAHTITSTLTLAFLGRYLNDGPAQWLEQLQQHVDNITLTKFAAMP